MEMLSFWMRHLRRNYPKLYASGKLNRRIMFRYLIDPAGKITPNDDMVWNA